MNHDERRALAFGRLTPHDAGLFCALCEEGLGEMRAVGEYIADPSLLPKSETAMWFLVSRLRHAVSTDDLKGASAERVNAFLQAVGEEFRFALLADNVDKWAEFGSVGVMLATLARSAKRNSSPTACKKAFHPLADAPFRSSVETACRGGATARNHIAVSDSATATGSAMYSPTARISPSPSSQGTEQPRVVRRQPPNARARALVVVHPPAASARSRSRDNSAHAAASRRHGVLRRGPLYAPPA